MSWLENSIYQRARQFIGISPELHNKRSEYIDHCEANLLDQEMDEALYAWVEQRRVAGRKVL